MPYVAVDEDGYFLYKKKPIRNFKDINKKGNFWVIQYDYGDNEVGDDLFKISKELSEKITGKELTWEDEPVELKEEK